jgi:REP element-mobilizing transposase RayT
LVLIPKFIAENNPMPIKRKIPFCMGTFFITFTCKKHIPLIQITNGYDLAYKWFRHLKTNGHYVNAFVVMPNHVHVIITITETETPINTIVGEGKRMMAYQIVSRLKFLRRRKLLVRLKGLLDRDRIESNHLHSVWDRSFHWHHLYSWNMINQKIDYIHNNPCKGSWNLAPSPAMYTHSSASFYISGIDRNAILTDIEFMRGNIDAFLERYINPAVPSFTS